MGMRRGQLFLIEVIIALSVLIVLVTTLFATQSFSPPVDKNELQLQGEEAIDALVNSGLMFKYLETADTSFNIDGNTFVDDTNSNKTQVVDTIQSVLPIIANFKVFTYQYSGGAWVRIDIVNFEVNTPSGGQITVVEYYTPGFNGAFNEYRFSMSLWYEVEAS